MPTVIDYRREVGPAAWLLLLYWQHSAPSDDPAWCLVADGDPIHDCAAASGVKASVSTATRWRRRLQHAGLIYTEACGGGGFRIWLLRFDRPDDAAPKRSAPAEFWPEMKTLTIQ
ncbi:MAG: hypothetical protein JO119_06050 [Acidobacteria bacterium]|nr:hypothetical protein [Acidobacteriota bacterium]